MSRVEQTGVASPDVIVETFNEQEVTNMVDDFDILGQNVYNSIKSMDSAVGSNIQVGSGAIAGKLGGILFNEWSENCVPMLNFKRFFDGISESMRRIYNRSSETYDAIDTIYKEQNPADANPALVGNSSMSEEVSTEAGIGDEQAAVMGQGDATLNGTVVNPSDTTFAGTADAGIVVPGVAASATVSDGTTEMSDAVAAAPVQSATAVVNGQTVVGNSSSVQPEVTDDDLPTIVKPGAARLTTENGVEMSIK